jgi:ankyrin repeat protein
MIKIPSTLTCNVYDTWDGDRRTIFVNATPGLVQIHYDGSSSRKKYDSPEKAIIETLKMAKKLTSNGLNFSGEATYDNNEDAVEFDSGMLEALLAEYGGTKKSATKQKEITFDPSNRNNCRKFIAAIESGDGDLVRRYVEEGGVVLNRRLSIAAPRLSVPMDEYNVLPLRAAIKAGHKDIVRYIVEHTDDYFINGSVFTYLTFVAGNKYLPSDAAETLLECGYDLDKDRGILRHYTHLRDYLPKELFDRVMSHANPRRDGENVLQNLLGDFFPHMDLGDLVETAHFMLDIGVSAATTSLGSPLNLYLEAYADNYAYLKDFDLWDLPAGEHPELYRAPLDEELIRKMIRNGADVKAKNNKGLLPLEILTAKNEDDEWEAIKVSETIKKLLADR